MIKIQYLKRKAGNPFAFKGAAFPDAVLALTGIREFSGVSAFGERDVTVIISAAAYASKAAMEANIGDPLRTFSFEFTRAGFTSKEYTSNGQIDVSISNGMVTAESLNIVVNDTPIAVFKYDNEYQGGRVFTNIGLQMLLQMPSITEGNTLGDEWETVSE